MDKLGNITLYNADCMDIMWDIPDKAFDLAIVDPPYGIGEDGRKNASRGKIARLKSYKSFAGEDKMPPPEEYFHELIRISNNQIIWGANHFISRIPFDSPCWIVWDKQNGENDFADCELAYTSFKSAVRKFTFRWHGMLQGDMKNKEARIHPTQKPVSLIEYLIKTYSNEGDLILDNTAGSMTTAIAAINTNRRCICIEKDDHYFEIGSKRVKDHLAQQKLF